MTLWNMAEGVMKCSRIYPHFRACITEGWMDVLEYYVDRLKEAKSAAQTVNTPRNVIMENRRTEGKYGVEEELKSQFMECMTIAPQELLLPTLLMVVMQHELHIRLAAETPTMKCFGSQIHWCSSSSYGDLKGTMWFDYFNVYNETTSSASTFTGSATSSSSPSGFMENSPDAAVSLASSDSSSANIGAIVGSIVLSKSDRMCIPTQSVIPRHHFRYVFQVVTPPDSLVICTGAPESSTAPMLSSSAGRFAGDSVAEMKQRQGGPWQDISNLSRISTVGFVHVHKKMTCPQSTVLTSCFIYATASSRTILAQRYISATPSRYHVTFYFVLAAHKRHHVWNVLFYYFLGYIVGKY
ncbi:uncharacterized protein EV420DRAFT_1754284 [Desarmillaria tabescens]|uniref:Uncharacterized protein n=1 Tax=Armillaria tabescens TaxID=1929756 RepID=A0AA39J3L7_ARMTA|nr:uncharacterized protein EV420DRAFT_1754284 [Desarmillaria tabescens]KAK0434984.1 hypothetical protein EV420DRAFT_1754284 [Desarmillaria tabescens]